MIIIGADESGTGAWAGPFTVCAVAIHEAQQHLLTKIGAADSKTLSDGKRRAMLDALIDTVIVGRTEFVGVKEMEKFGKQPSWRMAMMKAITHVAEAVGESRVVVDGVFDHELKRWLSVRGGITRVEFMPKADSKVPAVSAASIIAKTMRNDRMAELHQHYPEYNWKTNSGYGTPDHQAALEKHGKTVHHRPWKNLVDMPLRMTRVVNLRNEEHDVYIGRAGHGEDGYFGNPVRVGDRCSLCGKVHEKAGDTLPCFKQYFLGRVKSDPEFASKIEHLRGKRLGCFCKPGPCHGDVIVEWLGH